MPSSSSARCTRQQGPAFHGVEHRCSFTGTSTSLIRKDEIEELDGGDEERARADRDAGKGDLPPSAPRTGAQGEAPECDAEEPSHGAADDSEREGDGAESPDPDNHGKN